MNVKELGNMKTRLEDLKKKYNPDQAGHDAEWKELMFFSLYQVHMILDLIDKELKNSRTLK